VLDDAPAEHAIGGRGVEVHRLGAMARKEKLAYLAGLARGSRLPVYCHLVSEAQSRDLWGHGVRTVPVVHNARDGWRQDPAIWEGNPKVAFVVACGDRVAADLAAAGLTKPLRVMRLVVREPEAMYSHRRAKVRAALGAGETTLLVGMVGRFATQKRYTLAVRILALLRKWNIDARLAIVGGAFGEEGENCRDAALEHARQLGVSGSIVLTGPVGNAAKLIPAFDVFLNTSLWEGVSISTMEAVAAGVPVISADVGGQCEAVGAEDILVAADADEEHWARHVHLMAIRGARPGPGDLGVPRAAAASLWPWTLALGPGANAAPSRDPCDLMFVTANLDVGGAQRSLCNLVEHLALDYVGDGSGRRIKPVVAVAGRVGVPAFADRALAAGAEFVDVSGGSNFAGALRGRVGRILSLVLSRSPRVLCFWNMDTATKMAVANVMLADRRRRNPRRRPRRFLGAHDGSLRR
jgi:hypothetical protein